jgi:phosphoglycolate phosphatase
VLDAIAAHGVPMAILSNKPDAFTRRMVHELLGRWQFRAVVGQREGAPRKPDPASALAIAAELGVPPTACLLVGDTNTDMATARAAGMVPVGVLWGFRERGELEAFGARHVLGHPDELLPLLGIE